MKKLCKYGVSDSMSDLVEHDYRIWLVVNRFGIGLGFGDKTIGQTCQQYGVDPNTFLAVVVASFGAVPPACDIAELSPADLLDYLVGAQDYYLSDRFPAIRRQLVEVWEGPENDLYRALINYFDDMVDDMRKHAMEEEREIFPYVRALVAGNDPPHIHIERLSSTHYPILARLAELKKVLIKYYTARDIGHMSGILFYLYNFENELISHSRVEEMLLFPMITHMERKTERATQ
jgi:regulator of cell morphogenesis and NO signaling